MLSSLAWVYNVYCFVFIPQNAQTTQKPSGLSFSNPQNGLRFARQESTEMIACAAIGGEPC